MAVDLSAPARVSHVGPVISVEAGRPAQPVLVDAKNGYFFGQIETQGFLGNGEMLIAQAKKTAEGKNGVGYATVARIDYDILNGSEVLALGVDDLGAEDRFLRDNREKGFPGAVHIPPRNG